LLAGERATALLQTCLRETAVFEVFDVPLDEFAGVIGLRPTCTLGKLGEPPFNLRV